MKKYQTGTYADIKNERKIRIATDQLDKMKNTDAFQEGIPIDVKENRIIHNKPIAGDNGTIYEVKSGKFYAS